MGRQHMLSSLNDVPNFDEMEKKQAIHDNKQ